MKRYREFEKEKKIDYVVRLNVGGKIVSVFSSTLKSKNSVLKDATENESQFVKDKFDNLFVDVDPNAFQYIVDYLRTGYFPENIVPGNSDRLYERIGEIAFEIKLTDLLDILDWNNFTEHSFSIRKIYDVYRVHLLTSETKREFVSFDFVYDYDKERFELIKPDGEHEVLADVKNEEKEQYKYVQNYVMDTLSWNY